MNMSDFAGARFHMARLPTPSDAESAVPESIPAASGLIDGVVVVEADTHLSNEQRMGIIKTLEALWPERKVLVLDGGIKLHVSQHEAIARIEAKLDDIQANMQRRSALSSGPLGPG